MKRSFVAYFFLLFFVCVAFGARTIDMYAREDLDLPQNAATQQNIAPIVDLADDSQVIAAADDVVIDSQNRTANSTVVTDSQGGASAKANSADSLGQMTTDTYQLLYRLDEVSIDRSYLSNKDNIAKIVDHLQRSERIDSIAIYAYASPEGVYEHNLMLARRRAEAAKSFILSNLPDDKKQTPPHIILHPVAENWAGLRLAVEQNYHRADREKVLAIIDDPTISDDTREWRLKNRLSPESWNYIRRNLLPELRLATWVCVWQALPEPEQPLERQDVAITPAQAPVITLPQPPVTLHDTVVTKFPKTVFAMKTNLLYDAVTALNFEFELPIGDNFSLAAEDVFPWWTAGPNGKKYAFQMWEMGLEPRWWFKKTDSRDRLSGHYLGLYGMASYYDFQWDKAACYQGEYFSVGLSYGFAFPIARRLNLELGLSVGYLRSAYRHYQPDPDYEHLYRDYYNAGIFSYFGPTKLKVSLVVPIVKTRTVKMAR